jgi:hypothetical protein
VADALQKLFSDEVYCRQEIVRIREAWGDRRTFTVPMVDATLIELSRREVLGLFAGLLAASHPQPEESAEAKEENCE